MIRSFREYLVENISDGIEGGELRGILEKFKDKKEVVRYALYCAKEVEGYSKDTRVKACNDEVEKWLKGKEVNLRAARSQAHHAWRASTAVDAAYAAYAVNAAVNAAASAVNADVYAASAASYASAAKAHHYYPNDETKRLIASDQFRQEYIRLAQNWERTWENAPEELRGINQISPEIIYDYLQDNPIVLSKVIPNKDGKYYLNISGMEGEFVGNSEEEVLSKVMGSPKREIVLRILSKIIGRG